MIIDLRELLNGPNLKTGVIQNGKGLAQINVARHDNRTGKPYLTRNFSMIGTANINKAATLDVIHSVALCYS